MTRKKKHGGAQPPHAAPVPIPPTPPVPAAPPPNPIKEELEIRKLELEIQEKKLGQQFYKTPSFWFSVITAIAATVGIVGQHFVSEAKFDRSAADAKLAELDKRQAEEKAQKAKLEAEAADARAKEAVEERKSIKTKLTEAQKEVKRLEAQKNQELDQGSARQVIKAHNGEIARKNRGIGVFFQATSLSNQDLQELKPQLEKLSEIYALTLTHVGLTNEGLSQVAELRGLVELRVDGNPAISGDGLIALGNFGHLQVLGLGQTSIKDASLAHLTKLRGLQELYLYDTAVGDDGMVHLIGLPNLRVLSLTNTQVSDRGTEQLKTLAQLTELYLDGSSITTSGVARLTGLRRLKLLSLDDRQLLPSSVNGLKELPELKTLVLRGSKLDDDSLKLIKDLAGLQTVNVRGTRVTKDGVQELKRSLPRLEVVGVGGPLDPSTTIVRSESTADAPSVTLLKKWQAGTILGVHFMDGDPRVHAKVRQVAEEWTDYANLRFDFTPGSGPPEIRISLEGTEGSWSYIGTDILHVPVNQPTMNLGILKPDTDQKEYSRIVLHEFGHALGLFHEHQNPNANLPWDKEAVFRYYGDQLRWPPELIDVNILDKFSGSYRAFDPKSIMMYAFPARLFRGDFEIGINRALSTSDKEFIGKLYPPDSPPVNVVVGTPAIAGEISRAGQARYYTFYAPRKARYVIRCDGPTGSIQWHVSLFGPDSRTEHVSPGVKIEEELTSGIYYLTVKHRDVRSTGRFALKIDSSMK